MNGIQLSGANVVTADENNSEDVNSRIEEVKSYISDRVKEIAERWVPKDYNRSIFDFIDMAVVIGALANMTDTRANNIDTDQYINFVKRELISSSESQADVVATAFYCLMRCGLVHEMSLGGHNIRPVRQQVINGYSIGVTHDKSSDGKWYSIDTSHHKIVFYAHELLSAIKSCVTKCFDNTSNLLDVIRSKIQSPTGIKIIVVKVIGVKE